MRTDYDACVRRFVQDEAGQFLGVFQAVTVRNIYCLSRFIHTFIMVFLCKFADGFLSAVTVCTGNDVPRIISVKDRLDVQGRTDRCSCFADASCTLQEIQIIDCKY